MAAMNPLENLVKKICRICFKNKIADEPVRAPVAGDTSANVVLILTLIVVVVLAGLIFVRKRMIDQTHSVH